LAPGNVTDYELIKTNWP